MDIIVSSRSNKIISISNTTGITSSSTSVGKTSNSKNSTNYYAPIPQTSYPDLADVDIDTLIDSILILDMITTNQLSILTTSSDTPMQQSE